MAKAAKSKPLPKATLKPKQPSIGAVLMAALARDESLSVEQLADRLRSGRVEAGQADHNRHRPQRFPQGVWSLEGGGPDQAVAEEDGRGGAG